MNPIQTPAGVLVRCTGGPLGGKVLRIPSLDDSFRLEPEDNFGKPHNMASTLRQAHKYVLANRVSIDGIPMYRYGGIVR